MKNYDLSQYVLREGNAMLFPLTKEEISYLKFGAEVFSSYIRIPYFAKVQSVQELELLCEKLDMEDDYWFLKSQWAIVDIKARAIVGYLRLEQISNFNKIVFEVCDDKCKGIAREDALNLFVKFLSINNFYNIVLEDVDKKVVANEN